MIDYLRDESDAVNAAEAYAKSIYAKDDLNAWINFTAAHGRAQLETILEAIREDPALTGRGPTIEAAEAERAHNEQENIQKRD